MEVRYLMGIDGGGTKTTCLLATSMPDSREPQVVAQAKGGPSNPRALGIAACTEELHRVIESAKAIALEQSDVSKIEIDAAAIALAGVASDDVREALTKWAVTAMPGTRVAFVSDGEPILAAGTTTGTGVALIAGTGSFAYAKRDDGKVGTAGGWGYLLGDEGSGFSLGQRAVAEVARQLDGRATAAPMQRAVFDALAIADGAGLKQAVYECPDPRQRIASVATAVLQSAAQGDPQAERIVQQGAAELAELATHAARAIGEPTQRLELAVAGSLLVKSDYYYQQLLAQLKLQVAQFRQVQRVSDPAIGCLRLAASKLSAG